MQPMLNIALRAARSAGELIFRSTERLDVISVNEKDAKDYVTEIDLAAEQCIIAALRKAYPNHGILGEESGLSEGSGEGADYLWIIDPLDGTTNFVRGVPHYAVSIACKYRGVLRETVRPAPSSSATRCSCRRSSRACRRPDRDRSRPG